MIKLFKNARTTEPTRGSSYALVLVLAGYGTFLLLPQGALVQALAS